jgi:hypothetical protein
MYELNIEDIKVEENEDFQDELYDESYNQEIPPPPTNMNYQPNPSKLDRLKQEIMEKHLMIEQIRVEKEKIQMEKEKIQLEKEKLQLDKERLRMEIENMKKSE